MGIEVAPATIEEWQSAVRDADAVFHSVPPEFQMADNDELQLSHAGFADLIEFSPDDLVVTAQSGITVDTLQSLLAEKGRVLPLGGSPMPIGHWTLAEAIAINPPHCAEMTAGGWRDWVLGAKLLQGDGRVVKVGSRAVKNVAGYDVQKLIVGSRGTLAIVLEVTLLVASKGGLTCPPLEADAPWHIQRASLTDGPALAAAASGVPHVFHAESGTLWARTASDLPRFPGDWVMRPGALEPESEPIARLWCRAKEQLDPRGVLNPGYLRLGEQVV